MVLLTTGRRRGRLGSTLHVAVDANVLDAPWGGIPKHVDRIVRRLVEHGDRIDLLVNVPSWKSPIPGALSRPVRLKGRAPWRNIAVPAWTLIHCPDVFWAPETALPRWLPCPTVATVHDLGPLLFPGSKPPRHEQRFRTTLAQSARRATRIICVSETTAASAVQLWHTDTRRIRVIPNGVDEIFSPGDRTASKHAVKRRFGIEGRYVLHVGALEPRKGLDVLIDAAREAPWRLVLAGHLGYRSRQIAEAAKAVGAAILGRVTDAELLDLYRGAHAVAAPALHEGFGIVPLEAMACGTPVVVAGNSGALADIAGPAALRVDERRPEAWRAAITIAAAQRASIAPIGLAHAAKYRWDDVADATRAVFREAALAGRLTPGSSALTRQGRAVADPESETGR